MLRHGWGRRLLAVLSLAAMCVGADEPEGGVTTGDSKVSSRVLEKSGRRRPPQAVIGGQVCVTKQSQEACREKNGCSWCGGGSQNQDILSKRKSSVSVKDGGGASCKDWNACGALSGSCESRNSTACQLTGREADGQHQCLWCNSEERCVAKDAEEWGQCKGCDNVFDSGAFVDSCGICGGSCIFLSRQETVGVSLALCGNVIISISLNMQKHAHNLNEATSGGKRPYTSLPVWRLGMVLMVIGETGNFLAYAYAPATLVAPLGSVSVISNVILARYVLKEIITLRSLLGVALAIGGSVLIVTFAPSSDKQLTMEVLEVYMCETGFIVFCASIVATTGALFLLPDATKKRYVVIYTLICSLAGCLTVMCVKGVSTALILTLQGHNQFWNFLPWVLVAVVVSTAVVQLKYLNLAMMHFGASEVVPVYYVLFTFFSILGGIVLYKEYHQHCPASQPECHSTLYFLLGCFITFMGVYLISFGKKPKDKSEAGFREMSNSNTGEMERAGLLSADEVSLTLYPRTGSPLPEP